MAFLGVDLGTSAIKVAVVNERGERIFEASSAEGELSLLSPQPGWAEQHPDDWWNIFCRLSKSIPDEIRAQIEGIGIGYQMHGLVLLGGEGKVVRPSILWCDGRAVESGRELGELFGEEKCFRLRSDPGNFTLSKLWWVKKHEPEAFARAVVALLPGDFLTFRLTGRACTSPSGFSEMVSWDFDADAPADWAWDQMKASHLMPECVAAFEPVGSLTSDAARSCGLPKNCQVAYRSGDQPNNAWSLGCNEPGTVATIAGTSGVTYAVSDQIPNQMAVGSNPFLHVTHKSGAPRVGTLTCINGAGSFVRWVKETFCFSGYEEMTLLASGVPPGAEGVVMLPYINGPERTLGNRSISGVISGIEFGRASRAAVARAAFEAVVFAMRNGLVLTGAASSKFRAGQGSLFQSSTFREIFASCMGTPLEIVGSSGADGAARGALVSLQGGMPPEINVEARIVPNPDSFFVYDGVFERFQSLLQSVLNPEP